MQLTRAAEYAIRGTIYLAEQPNGKLSQISDIAEKEDVPETFMRKIIHILSKNGIIRSLRGKNGGVKLRKSPGKIYLFDIIEAIEGPIYLNRCLIGKEECDKIEDCHVFPVWEEAQEKLIDVLKKYSIADLINSKISEQSDLVVANFT